jgi:hypothetical protein
MSRTSKITNIVSITVAFALLLAAAGPAASPRQQARNARDSIEGKQQEVLDQIDADDTGNADIGPFRAAADTIARSLQTATFNKDDFSNLVVQNIPPGMDFNQAMVMMAQMVTQEHGMIVSVGSGTVQGPSVAIFDVTTQKGPAEMTIMLDDAGKILHWRLTGKDAGAPVQPVQPAQPAQPSRPPVMADANDINDFNDFEQPLRRTEIARRNEQRTWVTSNGKTQDMAEAAHTSAKTDLEFLREVAQSEGCTRSVAAIDMLLAARETAYAEVAERLEQQLREERERIREERRSRTRDDRDTTRRSRRSRTRDRDQTDPYQPPQY